MARSTAAQVGAGIDGHQPHQTKQVPSAPCSYVRITLFLEPVRQLDNAQKRMSGVLFVQQSHQAQILRRGLNRMIIKTGMTQPQKTALSDNADLVMLRIYQQTLLSGATGQIFF